MPENGFLLLLAQHCIAPAGFAGGLFLQADVALEHVLQRGDQAAFVDAVG